MITLHYNLIKKYILSIYILSIKDLLIILYLKIRTIIISELNHLYKCIMLMAY